MQEPWRRPEVPQRCRDRATHIPKVLRLRFPRDMPKKRVRIQAWLEGSLAVRTRGRGGAGAPQCWLLPINPGLPLPPPQNVDITPEPEEALDTIPRRLN